MNIPMTAGWLTDVTNWFKEQIVAVWHAFVAFMGDLFLAWFQHIVDVNLYVLSLLPVPDFLSGQTLGAMLGQAGPSVLWFVDVFQIGPAMAVISTSMVFYIVRRFLTLGIW